MLQKKKVCKCGCGIEGFIWSNGMLKQCFLESKPQKAIKKYSEKGLEKKKLKTENTKKLHKWFLKIFDKRKDENGFVYCYETGKPMHEDVYKMDSCIYSHCYPKSTFPQYALEDWNILLVLPDVHIQWETNREKTPKMLEYYKNINI